MFFLLSPSGTIVFRKMNPARPQLGVFLLRRVIFCFDISVLHCFALHCKCNALLCIALHCPALHWFAFLCFAWHFIDSAVHCFALRCFALLRIAFLCMALLCLALHLLEEALLCLWEGKADTCYGLFCIALHCFAFENRGRKPIDSMHVFFVDPRDADCTLTTKTGTTLASHVGLTTL